MGEDLAAWLGQGSEAHEAIFSVVAGTVDDGMSIKKVADSDPHEFGCLTFQAFGANCEPSLSYFPPSFMPGPPWGISFWAKRPEATIWTKQREAKKIVADKAAAEENEATNAETGSDENKKDGDCL